MNNGETILVAGHIGAHQYAAIHQGWPLVPLTNELELCRLIDLNDHWEWVEIESWKNHRTRGRFNTILTHLKNVVLT